jgi:hypothetical protein
MSSIQNEQAAEAEGDTELLEVADGEVLLDKEDTLADDIAPEEAPELERETYTEEDEPETDAEPEADAEITLLKEDPADEPLDETAELPLRIGDLLTFPLDEAEAVALELPEGKAEYELVIEPLSEAELEPLAVLLGLAGDA